MQPRRRVEPFGFRVFQVMKSGLKHHQHIIRERLLAILLAFDLLFFRVIIAGIFRDRGSV